MVDQMVLPVQDKGQTADTELATPDGEKVNDYDVQMLERFKNPKETLKHFKELQGFTSRVSNEKKTLEEENAALKAQLTQIEEEKQFGQSVVPSTNIPAPSQGYYTTEELETWATTRDIKKVAMRERGKDPKNFPQRWAMVTALGNEYPQLTYSEEGVSKLFEKADQRIKEATKEIAITALDQPEMQEKIRKIVSGEQPVSPSLGAYMPDSTTSTKIGLPPAKTKDYDSEIEKAKKLGDYDTVTKLVFEKQMNA